MQPIATDRYHCELAIVADPDVPAGHSIAADVEVEIVEGRFTSVRRGVVPTAGAERLAGLTMPGFANAHSHAFHRTLRGRTHAHGGSFWTWRTMMYEIASTLTPVAAHDLARAVYAEMASAGFTHVGEFHYLHHQPDGTPYDDPNEMAHALIDAARDAGIRITLLDACYLSADIDGSPLQGAQRRFGDGHAERWAERVDALANRYEDAADVLIAAAIHSVRAVPIDQLSTVVEWARARRAPLHAHVSEQPAENEACLARHGRTPVAILTEAGFGGTWATAVHATHLTDDDVRLLGATRTNVCFCPTTERDLGDGIGPADALVEAGAQLTLGTDQHARIDAFEEARAVELNLRLARQRRGILDPAVLLSALTDDGHASLGTTAGGLRPGAPADLVAVSLDSPRTAGASADTAPASVLYAASDADVTDVVVAGRRIVTGSVHTIGDVGRIASEAIGPLTRAR